MLGAAAGILILGAPIALQVEESAEIERALEQGIVEGMREALAQVTDREVEIDPGRGPCHEPARCAAVFERTGASDLVLLRLAGGPVSVRVSAKRVDRAGAASEPIVAKLPRDAIAPESLRALAHGLFPDPITPPVAASVDRPTALLWLTGGAALGGILAGTLFGIASLRTKAEIESQAMGAIAFEEASARLTRDQIAANVCFGAAAAAVGLGTYLWLRSDE